VYSYTACGRATLAGCAKAAPDGAVDRQVEIGIVHHDDNVLPTHFEMAPFEAGRAGLADDSSNFR